MSTYINISEKINDRDFTDLIEEIDNITNSLGIEFFIVGATARDLVLQQAFGIDPGRATRDVDIGVRVPSWDEFKRLRDALLLSENFSADRQSQRLIFKNNLPLDMLPFGLISTKDAMIRWPSGDGVEMNVQGFEAAHDNAITLLLRSEPNLEVSVASPVGLVVLKLIAWRDRPSLSKDAVDIGKIIGSYLDLGNMERLVADHGELLEDPDFDYVLAGARLLGRDIFNMADEELRQRLIEILEDILDSDRGLLFLQKIAGPGQDIDEAAKLLTVILGELT